MVFRLSSLARLIAALALLTASAMLTIVARSYLTWYPDGAEGYYETSLYAPAWVGSEWFVSLALLAAGTWLLYRRGHGYKLAALVLGFLVFTGNFNDLDLTRQIEAAIIALITIIGLATNLAFSRER